MTRHDPGSLPEPAGGGDAEGLLYLPPRVTRSEAEARFAKRARRPFAARRGRLELVGLPVHVFEARVRLRRGGEPASVPFVVDGGGGPLRRIETTVLEAVKPEQPPGVQAAVLPALVTPQEALERARTEIPWAVLGSALRDGGLRVREVRAAGVAVWPVWVQHLRRRRRRDVDLLCALGGGRPGAGLRAAVVAALCAAGTRDARDR